MPHNRSTRPARRILRSWSKKKRASARRARSTRSLPWTIATGSCVSRLLTTRKRWTSRPESSINAKYFWFCCIVRTRHSCGTSRNAAVERSRVDRGPFDQRSHFVEQRVGHQDRGAAGRLGECVDDAPAALREARDHLAFGAQRLLVGVGVGDLDVGPAEEAMAVGQVSGVEAEGDQIDTRSDRAAPAVCAPAGRSARSCRRVAGSSSPSGSAARRARRRAPPATP